MKNSIQEAQDIVNNIQVRESSLEAHEAIKPLKEIHYKFILKTMLYIGKPCTAREIEKHCVLDYHQISRRTSEMESKGMIKVTGRAYTIKNRPLLWEVA